MTSTPWTLTFDCAHPGELARFWALALGYVEKPPPAGFASWEEWLERHGVPEEEWDEGAYLADPDGRRPSISFLKVPEGKVVKNRVHLDLRVGGGRETPWEVRWPLVTAAVARLTAAGASVVGEHELDGRPDHVVMADPEGNEFCVV
ncbi:VOC family protein [Streptomyces flavofungini]|uniref:VOC family protein n=1 Tax=Streptomyces flavofungini TaxID=68200 RepID=UPI0025B1A126|nr:VOC family protein [Streptomyces flavofungini]WJV47390.1 VOC family protein [Streptomyces flavofungini]